MTTRESRNGAPRGAALAAPASDCDACREQALPLERIAAVLDRDAHPVDTALLSRAVLIHMRPMLQRATRRMFWRRLALGLALSLLPLPFVLAYDALLLQVVFAVARTILPESIALVLVFNYAALLALLLAVTYAAIPLLIARRSPLPQW